MTENNTKQIIQIGCNDGNDYVFDFLSKEGDFRGIFVDASNKALKLAEEKYSSFPNVEFRNLAVIDGYADTVSFYEPNDDSIHGCNSLSKDFLFAHNNFNLKEITVEAININELIKQSNFDSLDYLFVDAEGLDCALVNALNLKEFDIKNIIFEWMHSEGARTGSQTKLFEEVISKLSENNYSVNNHYSDDWNLIATKK
jgi:FkbM family methyltransferase